MEKKITKKDGKYIEDQLESQPWSRKMGQVQVIVAGDKDKKKSVSRKIIKNKMK